MDNSDKHIIRKRSTERNGPKTVLNFTSQYIRPIRDRIVPCCFRSGCKKNYFKCQRFLNATNDKKKINYSQHKNPNIIYIMPSETDCHPMSPKRPKQEIPDKSNYSQHKNPNIICIVPSDTDCHPTSPKRPQLEISDEESSSSIDLSFLYEIDVDFLVSCMLNGCDEKTKSININMEVENNKGSFENGDIKDNTQIADMIENEVDCPESYSVLKENLLSTIEDKHTKSNENSSIEVSSNPNDCKEKENQEKVKDKNKLDVTSKIVNEPNKICTTNDINTCVNSTSKKYNNLNELLPKEESENSVNSKLIPSLSSLNGDFKCHKTQVAMTLEPLNQHNRTKVTENHNKLSSKSESKVENIKEVTHDKTSKTDMGHITENKETVLANRDDQDKNFDENLEKQLLQYLKKDYSAISQIHSGKYSYIFKCKDSDSRHYAVKFIHNKFIGSKQQKLTLKEIQVNIPEDNLLFVKMLNDFFIQNKWCFVMDFYPKNLKEVLEESKKNFHIDKIQELGYQLVTAVTILGIKRIVHSDLQPRHILLDSTMNKLKVCGFDEAYFLGYGSLPPFGKPNCYRAPEILLEHPAGIRVDVWSIALVLHEMATGIQLFGGCLDRDVLYKQICVLGHVPYSMINMSQYRDRYEYNRCVQKKNCVTHKKGFSINKETIISKTIYGAYYSHWLSDRNDTQIKMDRKKIAQLINLINQMLITNPAHRPFIDIISYDPFFYNFFRS